MNNWWWVQYLCGMAVMCSGKNMHLNHLFFTEIPAVFKRNVFIRKPRYFNIFSASISVTTLFICSSHRIFGTGSWNSVSSKIFYKERLLPLFPASPWPQSCRQTMVVPDAYGSLSHWHSCQWSSSSMYSCIKRSQPWTGFCHHDTGSTLLFKIVCSRLAEYRGNGE